MELSKLRPTSPNSPTSTSSSSSSQQTSPQKLSFNNTTNNNSSTKKSVSLKDKNKNSLSNNSIEDNGNNNNFTTSYDDKILKHKLTTITNNNNNNKNNKNLDNNNTKKKQPVTLNSIPDNNSDIKEQKIFQLNNNNNDELNTSNSYHNSNKISSPTYNSNYNLLNINSNFKSKSNSNYNYTKYNNNNNDEDDDDSFKLSSSLTLPSSSCSSPTAAITSTNNNIKISNNNNNNNNTSINLASNIFSSIHSNKNATQNTNINIYNTTTTTTTNTNTNNTSKTRFNSSDIELNDSDNKLLSKSLSTNSTPSKTIQQQQQTNKYQSKNLNETSSYLNRLTLNTNTIASNNSNTNSFVQKDNTNLTTTTTTTNNKYNQTKQNKQASTYTSSSLSTLLHYPLSDYRKDKTNQNLNKLDIESTSSKIRCSSPYNLIRSLSHHQSPDTLASLTSFNNSLNMTLSNPNSQNKPFLNANSNINNNTSQIQNDSLDLSSTSTNSNSSNSNTNSSRESAISNNSRPSHNHNLPSDIKTTITLNRSTTEHPQQQQQFTSVLTSAKLHSKLNENLATTPNIITVSSASSTASSSSSPPTFNQANQNNTSTPSSQKSASPPAQSNSDQHQSSTLTNQITPTIQQPTTPTVRRFIIKKVSDSELLNPSTPNRSTPTDKNESNILTDNTNKPSINDQLNDNLIQQTNENKNEQEKLNINEVPAQNINADITPNQNIVAERRISKFTVKKVDSNELISNNNSTIENVNIKNENKTLDDLSKISQQEKTQQEQQSQSTQDQQQQQSQNQQQTENAQQQSINNIVNNLETQYQNSQLAQTQQGQKINQIDKDFENDREKDADILEDEKPIDESPNKRFLKYDTQIGHGSFKTVYKGLDTESGVPVAWCELHDRKFNRNERQRFIEEADLLKQLQHPNIVRFYEYWEDKIKPKKIILVTELMTSGTLKAYVQRFKKQDNSKRFKVIKNFASQILKGLAYLHSRSPPVIHRDLKCDNVFVTGQCGQVKIGDLGLATLKKASFAKSVIGTPEFMAPEMYSEQYDESIDVYAFGMCLLEMATGEYPYQECSKPFEIYKRVTQGIKPENYKRIDNDDLKELIDLCIRLKRHQRPSVKELLNHSWFMENNGLKIEILRDKNSGQISLKGDSIITFRLKIIDKTKRKSNWPNWPDNEEIEVIFDVKNDDPEQIVKELKENTNKISDEDVRYLVQAIKDKCLVFKLEREDKEEEMGQISTNTASNSTSSISNPVNTNSEVNQTVSIQPPVNQPNQQSQQSQQPQQLQQSQQQQQQQQPHQQQIGQNQTNYTTTVVHNVESISNNKVDTNIYQNSQQQQQPNIINPNFDQTNTNTIIEKQQKQVKFFDQNDINDAVRIDQNKVSHKSEVKIKLSIIDVSDTGDSIRCVLELDESEKIPLNFSLSTDSYQSITSNLINHSTKLALNEYAYSLSEFVQLLVQYIGNNIHNTNLLKNQQYLFTLVLSKIKQNEVIIEKSNLNENIQPTSTGVMNANSNITIQPVQVQHNIANNIPQAQIQPQNQFNQQQQQQYQTQKVQPPQQQQQPQQPQQTIINQVSNLNNLKSNSQVNINLNQQPHPTLQQQQQQQQPQINLSQSNSSYELFKNLQKNQIKLNAELQQIQNRVEMNSSNLNQVNHQTSNQQTNFQHQNQSQQQQMNKLIRNNIDTNQAQFNSNNQTPILNQSLNFNKSNNMFTPNNISHQDIIHNTQLTGSYSLPATSDYDIQSVIKQNQHQLSTSIQYPNIAQSNIINQNGYYNLNNQMFSNKPQQQQQQQQQPPQQQQFIMSNVTSKTPLNVQPIHLNSIQVSNGPISAPIVQSTSTSNSSKLTSPTNILNKPTDSYNNPIHLSNNSQIATHQIQQQFQNQNFIQNEQNQLTEYLLNSNSLSNNNNNNLSSSSSSSIIGVNTNDTPSVSNSYSNNSTNQISSNLDLESSNLILNHQKPTYASIVATPNTTNTLSTITENVIQSQIQNMSQLPQLQHQNNPISIIPRKHSFNIADPFINTTPQSHNETIIDQTDLSSSNLNLDDSKMIPTQLQSVANISSINNSTQNLNLSLNLNGSKQQPSQQREQEQANNLIELRTRLKNVLEPDKHVETVSTPPIIETNLNPIQQQQQNNIIPTGQIINEQLMQPNENNPKITLQNNSAQTNQTQIQSNSQNVSIPHQQPLQHHHNPHHHLNDSSTFSPSNPLSRRSSVDLKDRVISSNKQINQIIPPGSSNIVDQTKMVPMQIYNSQNYPIDQVDSNLHNNLNDLTTSSQFNKVEQQQQQQQQQQSHGAIFDPNILNLVTFYPSSLNPNMFLTFQQHQQLPQVQTNQQNQLINQSIIQNAYNQQQQQNQQQSAQQQLQYHPNHMMHFNDKYNTFIENQLYSQRLSSIPNIVLNNNFRSNLEDLFMRHRREIEDLYKRQQNEFQDYVLEYFKQTANQMNQSSKKD